MRSIEITLAEELLVRVDQAVGMLGTSRAAFIREAIEDALHRYAVRRMEEADAAGYARIPARSDEVTEWIGVQVWDDEIRD